MFTGIIQTMGEVTELTPKGGDLRLAISANADFMQNTQMGDSIANNGVCLTVIDFVKKDSQIVGFCADVSTETLDNTTVKHWQLGHPVNLEKALTPHTHMGGHFVSGHVDGVGRVLSRENDARAVRFRISSPLTLAKYIAKKGSITVDGTSLTVNEVDGNEFELAIVPHTLAETIIDHYQVGTEVNLEVDLIARYLERLLGDRS